MEQYMNRKENNQTGTEQYVNGMARSKLSISLMLDAAPKTQLL
jgi:hypothetical protein